MIVTRKHLHRRTFLKGMGAAIALPMLDAMTPAFAAAGAGGQGAAAPGLHVRAQRHHDGRLDAEGGGARVRVSRAILKPLEAFRKDTVVLSGLAHKNGIRARRRPRRSRAGGRVVSHRRASAQDRRRRHPERHLRRSDRRAASRRRRRASRRSSWAATTRAPSATATPAIRAPTPTASPGAVRRPRCPRKRTRAWSSSGCSATSTRACSPETRARRHADTAGASSTSSASARRSSSADLGSDGSPQARRIPDVDPRDRAAHREGREGPHRPRADHRQADRHPRAVRRVRQPDVRPAARRVPDRLDAHRHDDDGPRGQHADLPGDRRARSASPADPSPQQPGVGREGDARSTRCTWSSSPASSRSSRPRRTATGRSSITR